MAIDYKTLKYYAKIKQHAGNVFIWSLWQDQHGFLVRVQNESHEVYFKRI